MIRFDMAASGRSYFVALAKTKCIPTYFLAVLLAMIGVGKVIAPIISPTMLMDFTACGRILTLAAGLRVAGIKNTAITNLIPALALVIPLSGLWSLLWR